MVPCWRAVWGVTFKISLFFGVRFERLKSWQKQTYRKTEACKLYSGVFWIFLPNVIKIDPYSFELYRFKLGAFFLRHSVHPTSAAKHNKRSGMWQVALCDPKWQVTYLVTSTPSIAVFRSRLKTHLFSIAYPTPLWCDCTVPAQWRLVALDTIIVLPYLLTNIP